MPELQVLNVSGTTGGMELQVLNVAGTITALSTANLQVLKVSGSVTGLPVARAGADVVTDALLPVVLDGGGSDFAGSYDWVVAGGPAVVITGDNTATPTVIAPADKDGTTVTLRLTVNGGSTDTVSITTGPHLLWRLNGSSQWVPFRRTLT